MGEDFKDHPVSVAEVRSAKTRSASDWTPRDALVATLREIDSGKLNVEAIIICMRTAGDKPGAAGSVFKASSPDPHITLGLLTRTTQQILTGDG